VHSNLKENVFPEKNFVQYKLKLHWKHFSGHWALWKLAYSWLVQLHVQIIICFFMKLCWLSYLWEVHMWMHCSSLWLHCITSKYYTLITYLCWLVNASLSTLKNFTWISLVSERNLEQSKNTKLQLACTLLHTCTCTSIQRQFFACTRTLYFNQKYCHVVVLCSQERLNCVTN